VGGLQTAPVLYIEKQRFRQTWLTLVMVATFALTAYAFYEQIILGRPFGRNPGPDWLVWLIFIVIGLALPILVFSIRLIVCVKSDFLLINFSPLKKRLIHYSEIKMAESTTYRPIREYGGWGIRGWSSDKMAYTIYGHKGVMIGLADGRKVLIGSQSPDQLAAAIRSVANI